MFDPTLLICNGNLLLADSATTLPVDSTTGGLNLYTTGGTVAVAFAVTEVLKRVITPKTPILSKIPTLVIPILVALILAILANRVFKTQDGKPILSGDLGSLLTSVFMAAASASGVFQWLQHPSRNLGESEPLSLGSNSEDNTMKPNPMLLIPVAIAAMFIGGCATCPEKAALREAVDQGTAQIRQNEANWAKMLVAYPVGTTDPRTGQPSTGKNMADKISPLTPQQYDQEQKTQQEYNDLIAEDRARDSGKAQSK